MVAKGPINHSGVSSPRRHRPSTFVVGGKCSDNAFRPTGKAAEVMSSTSESIVPSSEETVPRVSRDELCVGELLGKGGFSCVYEVFGMDQPIPPSDSDANDKDDADDRKRGMRESDETRESFADKCIREKTGDSRYVIKFIRASVEEDPHRFRMGADHLAIETRILSKLDHPNIVKIRGLSRQGVMGFGDPSENFLILDRLYDTLRVRMEIWKAQESKFKGLIRGRVLDSKGGKRRGMLADRLKVAFDIAGALKYLHEKNIIYRDLKPDNVGFDVRGEVKLFDFGLAKELHPKCGNAFEGKPLHQREERPFVNDESFNLTGKTGTQRYMAPEVASWKPYNFKADVYSLGTMLWEMVSLKRVYGDLTKEKHREIVLKGTTRPPLNKKWPFPIRSLLACSWSPDPTNRPTMSAVCGILREEIVTMRNGDETGLEHSSRTRSTFVLDGGERKSFYGRSVIEEQVKVSPSQ